MKIILSRKGFDSGSGKMPNPILTDGTMLAMPIPDCNETVNSYEGLHYGKNTFYDIIHSLTPGTKIQAVTGCHLDPDLRRDVRDRSDGWMPAFGQTGASLGHLDNMGVNTGDLFLFFGWFHQTEFSQSGGLRFVPSAPDIHALYGYMQIGKIIRKPSDVTPELVKHPHADARHWEHNNAIFLPTARLSFLPEMSGYGIFDYDKKLVLTKEGCRRRIWNLPYFFKDIHISYHPSPWTPEGFRSVARGQEFVFEADEEDIEWVKNLICTNGFNI